MHHGMLTIYKEKGYTSSDAVARLRGILRMRKIGHTGTLDPDAEGVLPMCLGNATRICELIADRDKEYLAVMRLGVRTDTQDMSGEILSRIPEEEILPLLCGGGPLTAESASRRICREAAAFTGGIDQVPPMYSAIKVNGKRLYDMARKGITVERKARRITIYALEVEKIDLPLVTMRVCCSKGTYIRTLCEDLGNALGTGAAMESLLRTRVGCFTLEEAKTLDEIEYLAKTDPQALLPLIRPVDRFFGDLDAAYCEDDALRLLKNGNALSTRQLRIAQTPAQEADPASGGEADPASGVGADPASGGEAAGTGPVEEASGNRSGTIGVPAPVLPGTGPRDQVVRVYDRKGTFYGLYIRRAGQKRFTAYRMFLPETPL